MTLNFEFKMGKKIKICSPFALLYIYTCQSQFRKTTRCCIACQHFNAAVFNFNSHFHVLSSLLNFTKLTWTNMLNTIFQLWQIWLIQVLSANLFFILSWKDVVFSELLETICGPVLKIMSKLNIPLSVTIGPWFTFVFAVNLTLHSQQCTASCLLVL